MRRRIKTGSIIAASLIAAGLLLFAGVMIFCDWDFARLSTENYETHTYEISEDFLSLSVFSEADLILAPAKDDLCRVVCYEPENCASTVKFNENDQTLMIDTLDEREWYEHISISLDSPKITVFLPNDYYHSLFVKSGTGSVSVPGSFWFDEAEIIGSTGAVRYEANGSVLVVQISTGTIDVANTSIEELDLSVSTGDLTVSNTDCRSIKTSGSTGSVMLSNVIARKTISVERTTGDVKFEGSDAPEVDVKTDTGNVTGFFRRNKNITAESSVGKISYPQKNGTGLVRLATATGDILISECPADHAEDPAE